MGFEESRLAAELGRFTSGLDLEKSDLGVCVGADGMMRIAPGLVRIPDLSFITWDRLPGRESPQEPILDSKRLTWPWKCSARATPSQRWPARSGNTLAAGVVLVWLIDPKKRTARVYSTVEKSTLIRADQSLDGGLVLPGFVLRLSDLLDRGRRPRRD